MLKRLLFVRILLILLYRMIPLIGLMYKTFGKYREENLSYSEKSEKEIIEWINN